MDFFKAFVVITSLTAVAVGTFFLVKSTKNLTAKMIIEASKAVWGKQGNKEIHALMTEQRADTIVGYRFTFFSFCAQMINQTLSTTPRIGVNPALVDLGTWAGILWVALALLEVFVLYRLGRWMSTRLNQKMKSEIDEAVAVIEAAPGN